MSEWQGHYLLPVPWPVPLGTKWILKALTQLTAQLTQLTATLSTGLPAEYKPENLTCYKNLVTKLNKNSEDLIMLGKRRY